jgi:hypothetical protein
MTSSEGTLAPTFASEEFKSYLKRWKDLNSFLCINPSSYASFMEKCPFCDKPIWVGIVMKKSEVYSIKDSPPTDRINVQRFVAHSDPASFNCTFTRRIFDWVSISEVYLPIDPINIMTFEESIVFMKENGYNEATISNFEFFVELCVAEEFARMLKCAS